MSLTHFGVAPNGKAQTASALPGWLPRLPIGAPEALVLLLLAAALGGAGYLLVQRGRRVSAS
jgi:hypothetical protein